MTSAVGRLHYFNLRGRGELIRLVCAYGKLPLEEEIVPMTEEFLQKKPTYPFGQLPIMEIEGKKYSQSMAITRYLGKRAGLYPLQDPLAALEVDMIMDQCADVMTSVIQATFRERDAAQREKLLKRLNKTTLPVTLRGFQQRIYSTDAPFFLGKAMSLADLAVFDLVRHCLMPKTDVFPVDYAQEYPQLMTLVENVERLPTIAAYLEAKKDLTYKF